MGCIVSLITAITVWVFPLYSNGLLCKRCLGQIEDGAASAEDGRRTGSSSYGLSDLQDLLLEDGPPLGGGLGRLIVAAARPVRRWMDEVGCVCVCVCVTPARHTCVWRTCDKRVASWALEVFLNLFTNKKLFFAFFIKLIWLGVGFLNRTGEETGC